VVARRMENAVLGSWTSDVGDWKWDCYELQYDFCYGFTIREANIMIAAVQLALNNISPSPATLGTLNALALALNSGIRACTPALFTALFALGVGNHILYGQFIWFIMIILSAGLAVSLYWLPMKAEGSYRLKKNNDAEENGDRVGEESESQEEQNGHLER